MNFHQITMRWTAPPLKPLNRFAGFFVACTALIS
ncbi:MAG: hypothetical protein ACI8YI_001539, partial [Paracoccaceae bacterium]